jgi:hypothetical protein
MIVGLFRARAYVAKVRVPTLCLQMSLIIHHLGFRLYRPLTTLYTDTINNSMASHSLAIYAPLQSQFGTVLNSSVAGSKYKPSALESYEPL